MSTRIFIDTPAKLEKIPLFVGLVGPSGSGKTFSALRLATGIQKVSGGDIGYVDTEARRALHYANKFKFRHLPFIAPFSPLDYLAAIEHLVNKGIKTIVVDSMSHEHEGPGGVLEEHDAECDRMVKQWNCSRESVQMTAWAEPKKKRRRLINSILQMDVNAIFCFRAKEKIKPVKGRAPIDLGWMPIAGEEFLFDMTVNCLLYPRCGGVPTWKTREVGEESMIKMPEFFLGIFEKPRPLDEGIGEQMATWAAGAGALQSDAQAVKKRDPNKALAAIVGMANHPDAEARILASIERNHVTELSENDIPKLESIWRQLKDATTVENFDRLCPQLQGATS